jgi:hypothetical protein
MIDMDSPDDSLLEMSVRCMHKILAKNAPRPQMGM